MTGEPVRAETRDGVRTLTVDRPEKLNALNTEVMRQLEGAVTAINAQFDIILGALPGIARKAAIVAERRPQ